MTAIGAPLRKWTACLLFCTIPTCALAPLTNETAAVDGTRSSLTAPAPSKPPWSPSDSTCPFRTINYITHTLPQQCLRTGWVPPAPNVAPDGTGAAVATETLDVAMPSTRQDASGSDPRGEAEGSSPPSVPPSKETASASAHAAAAAASLGTQAEVELEADSPFDNANFLSFEEWKKKNLERAGQSPDSVGHARGASPDHRNRRRPVNVNALDSLGEEGEIEIDFGGFGSPSEGQPMPDRSLSDAHQETATSADGEGRAAPSSWALSKDAGKTCKERFNYASFDCAATVLKTNPRAKSTSSILVENKDSYMLNECTAQNKFIIVELCEDILVDTVVLANYEFFSSMFRHFRVSVSDRYPVKLDRWRVLGTFEARNSREIQPFLITEPQIWARYLRIEFLSHYGNEFYCPVSLLRIHGTTMMEQFRREEEQARGDDDFAEPIDEAAGEPVQTAVAHENEGGVSPEETLHNPDTDTRSAQDAPPHADGSFKPAEVSNNSGTAQGDLSFIRDEGQPSVGLPKMPISTASDSAAHMVASDSPSANYPAHLEDIKDGSEIVSRASPHASIEASSSSSSPIDVSKPNSSTRADDRSAESKSISSHRNDAKPPTHTNGSSVTSTASDKGSSDNANSGSQPPAQTRTSVQTQPNTPPTQESFFKSISKRLQYLEANSTLSLQYIEEQSRILRDAFVKVEKKQLQKTEKFLEYLNRTVMVELKNHRHLYEQLWQSTVLEIEGIKERQATEIGEIGARLSMVADELVWQKRMAVVQSTLLLLCLGLVLFSRSGTLGSQADVPIAQQLGNTYSSFFYSPSQNTEDGRRPRRRRTFRSIWRSDDFTAMSDRSDMLNAVSDAETDGLRSPLQVAFSPGTPATSGTMNKEVTPGQLNDMKMKQQDNGPSTPTEEAGDALDEQAKRLEVLETQSGPATPRGSRDNRPSWEEVDRAVDLLKAEEMGQGPQRERKGSRGSKKRRSPLRRAESYTSA